MIFRTAQDLFMAVSMAASGIFAALILNLGTEILKSLWSIEAHLAKGNYDYSYVNKLEKTQE